jgi:hypothetical protein
MKKKTSLKDYIDARALVLKHAPSARTGWEDGKDRVLHITIDLEHALHLESGRKGEIHVHADDNHDELARQFCQRYALEAHLIPQLAAHIGSLVLKHGRQKDETPANQTDGGLEGGGESKNGGDKQGDKLISTGTGTWSDGNGKAWFVGASKRGLNTRAREAQAREVRLRRHWSQDAKYRSGHSLYLQLNAVEGFSGTGKCETADDGKQQGEPAPRNNAASNAHRIKMRDALVQSTRSLESLNFDGAHEHVGRALEFSEIHHQAMQEEKRAAAAAAAAADDAAWQHAVLEKTRAAAAAAAAAKIAAAAEEEAAAEAEKLHGITVRHAKLMAAKKEAAAVAAAATNASTFLFLDETKAGSESEDRCSSNGEAKRTTTDSAAVHVSPGNEGGSPRSRPGVPGRSGAVIPSGAFYKRPRSKQEKGGGAVTGDDAAIDLDVEKKGKGADNSDSSSEDEDHDDAHGSAILSRWAPHLVGDEETSL